MSDKHLRIVDEVTGLEYDPLKPTFRPLPHQQKILDMLKVAPAINLSLASGMSYEMRAMRRMTNMDDHFLYGMPLIVHTPREKDDSKLVITHSKRRSMGVGGHHFMIDWPMRTGKNTFIREFEEEWSRSMDTMGIKRMPAMPSRVDFSAYLKRNPDHVLIVDSLGALGKADFSGCGHLIGNEAALYKLAKYTAPPFRRNLIMRNLIIHYGAHNG